ncbi:N-acetyltransferase [Legionella taurinensis]|uniref:N-acetyltransferase n=1 Tax=Legionella taurinensis TaxID=70611 RepID=A0A3A5LG05_9GAMM|nr:GNAT family protein [Legionella taurinensis]MDX1837999.1 GNAT family protein [Legionella taurinensis]PUT39413.1 GNAT family N-acetyltransferase [Legionella taurinensis]PUT41722.1 GNAT family N-acetyltransferase [Legionella taurinensis]PUT44556.1 GNAT family N-acetyltransferase [Legionella taurinensis]PUT46800.1 GNAT family N-acetyltransferase [Legionella taurinensis]
MNSHLVTLRFPLQSDSANYFKWINDKELVLFNGNFKEVSQQEHQQWFDNLFKPSDAITFSILENQDNKLIGSCSLRNISQIHHNAELQIRIGEREYQNRGYGSDAVRKLVDWGFSSLNLKRIYLNVLSTNQRAIKAYQKCDFQIEGILRKAACIDGNFIDLVVMAIIK